MNVAKDVLFVVMFLTLILLSISGSYTFDRVKELKKDINAIKNQQMCLYSNQCNNKTTSATTYDNRVVKVIAPKKFSAEMTVIDGHDYLVLHDLSVPSVNIIHYSDCKRCKRR